MQACSVSLQGTEPSCLNTRSLKLQTFPPLPKVLTSLQPSGPGGAGFVGGKEVQKRPGVDIYKCVTHL